MDPSKILERFLDRPGVAELRRVLDVYSQAPGGLLANGLAFAALFASFPVALVTLGVAGWLVDDPTVQAQLARAIGALLPPLRDLVDQALLTLSDGAAITSAVGLVGLIWTVSQFYVTLDVAFARIFAGRQERNVFRRAARGFVSVAGLVGIVVALIVGGSLAAAAEVFLPASSTALIGLGRVLSSVPFVTAVGVGGRGGRLPRRAAALAVVVGGPGAGGRRGRGDRRAQPAVPVRGAAADRCGAAHGFARDGVRRARLAVVHVPGAVVRRGLGPGPR